MDPILQQITQVVSKYDVDRVILFGSRANNTFTERSDYDLAFYANGLEENSKTAIYFELEEIDTLKKIDVVWMDGKTTVNQLLVQNIESGGIVIYERQTGAQTAKFTEGH